MNKMHLMGLTVAAVLASSLALAQTAPKAQAEAQPQHRTMRIDANGDGRISKEEAAAFPKMAARFDAMDVNKDGFIDKADRQLRMQQQRDACFDKADTNKDGQLSRDEFNNMREACGMNRNGMRGHGMRGHMWQHGGHHKMGGMPPAAKGVQK